jgi:DNA-binding NarL/FixJ family response regulator
LEKENGLEVAEKLKAVDESLKIIIITGYPSHETAVRSIKAGLFDYLSKGSSNEKILETLRKALRARKTEILEKGETAGGEPLLKYLVVCKHSFIKERLENFSFKRPDFRLMKTFNSVEQLKEAGSVPQVDVALICATCCIETFDNAFPFFNDFYKMLPLVRPVLFNQHFSEKEKIDLIRIGVRGFFSIDMDSERLEKALLSIKQGEIWASRRLAGLSIPSGPEYLKNYMQVSTMDFSLSGREKEILQAMVVGLKNKEIADKLFISEVTVKSHINRIYKKFGVNNRTRAIRFAMENNIL